MLTLITKIIPICTNVPQINTDLLTVQSQILTGSFSLSAFL